MSRTRSRLCVRCGWSAPAHGDDLARRTAPLLATHPPCLYYVKPAPRALRALALLLERIAHP